MKSTRAIAMNKGFTLVEMLVVVAIIMVLIAIMIPTMGHARRRGKVAATASLINNIAIALEAYKGDMGQYPTFATGPASSGPDAGYVKGWGTLCVFEFCTLARGLVGFEEQSTGEWGKGDGADGPGFRLVPGGEGRVYGPYLAPTAKNFKLLRSKADLPNPVDPDGGTWKGSEGANYGRDYSATTGAFIDAWGQPIFYWPGDPRPTGGGQAVVVNKKLFGNAPGGNKDACIFMATNPDVTAANNLYYIVGGVQVNSRLVPFTPRDAWTADTPYGAVLAPYSDSSTVTNPKPGYKFRALLGMSDPTSATTKLTDRIVGQNTFLLVSAGPDNQYYTGDEVINEYSR